MPDSMPDTIQIRRIVDQIMEAAAERKDPPVVKSEIPTPLKWAGGIIAGLMTVGSAGLLFWMIASISEMQLTLARMDERQSMNAANWEAKFSSLDERMARLEKQQEAR